MQVWCLHGESKRPARGACGEKFDPLIFRVPPLQKRAGACHLEGISKNIDPTRRCETLREVNKKISRHVARRLNVCLRERAAERMSAFETMWRLGDRREMRNTKSGDQHTLLFVDGDQR